MPIDQMPIDQMLVFITVTLFVSASPGPVMLSTMANGGMYGVRHAAWGMAGATAGNLILIALSFIGMALILKNSTTLFRVLQWAGAAYLIWLGIKMYRQPIADDQSPIDAIRAKPWVLFLKSVGVALSNPKGLVYFGAFFPQFISLEYSLTHQLLLMVGAFVVIDVIWMLIYAQGGSFVAGWLRSPQQRRGFNRISGGALIGAGILMAAL
jgi:threonine/homoserine/homoserine lactone efflux protein